MTKTKTAQFGDAYRELEEIVAWFEKDDIDLDEGLKKFERGLELAAQCRERLKSVENKVTEIKAKFGETSAEDAE